MQLVQLSHEINQDNDVPVFPFGFDGSTEFDDIVFYDEFECRVHRGNWLKRKFGKNPIPHDLFKAVIDAEITTAILDRWFKYGGSPHILAVCNLLFPREGVDDYVIYTRLRKIQEKADGPIKRNCSSRIAKKSG